MIEMNFFQPLPPDIIGPSRREALESQGICEACTMKHFPFCYITLCRSCGCGKEWHPLDGRCRVGPETEFTLHDCYCLGYVPKDNLEYINWLYEKGVK